MGHSDIQLSEECIRKCIEATAGFGDSGTIYTNSKGHETSGPVSHCFRFYKSLGYSSSFESVAIVDTGSQMSQCGGLKNDPYNVKPIGHVKSIDSTGNVTYYFYVSL